MKRQLLIILSLLLSLSLAAQTTGSYMGGSLFPVRVNDRYGYIDQRGKLVIKPQFIDAREFSEGLARVWVAGGKGRWGYVDLTGKMAIPAQFEWAEDFSEGLAVVKIDGKYGVIDKTGQLLFTMGGCRQIGYFHESLATVQDANTGKWGYIGPSGDIVIQAALDYAGPFHESVAAVRFGSDWVYMDRNGKPAIPYKFERAENFSEGLAAIQINGKWGFIDKTGNWVINHVYDGVENFSEGLAAVRVDGEWGFIDKTGTVVIPIKYNLAKGFSEGLAAVRVDAEKDIWCYIDKAGRRVATFTGVTAENFSNGLARLSRENLNYEGADFLIDYIDKSGKRVWQEK